MSCLSCPVCGEGLVDSANSLKCENGHSFDKAKSGYVNLLMSQAKKNKRHGDDKAMVVARQSFLSKGYYSPLLSKLLSVISQRAKEGHLLLDIGCGEGYYTDGIYQGLKKSGVNMDIVGVDISRDAVDLLAKRNKEIELCVASAFKIPIQDKKCDIIISVFAPISYDEVKRLLKKDGIFIRVYPLKNHLMSLKSLVYDSVYENDTKTEEIDGLQIIDQCTVTDKIVVNSNEDIRNLFMMTPYYYKTGKSDQAKLEGVETLETDIEFMIDIYKG